LGSLAGIFNAKDSSYTSEFFSENGIRTPSWSARGSSAYFPQLDFFPRYNQWFASTLWSTPYRAQDLVLPPGLAYSIMLVYIDKLNKTVYYRLGTASFIQPQTATGPEVFIRNTRLGLVTSSAFTLWVNWETVEPAQRVYKVKIRFNSVGLVAGEAEVDLSSNIVFAEGSKTDSFRLANSGYGSDITAIYNAYVNAGTVEVAVVTVDEVNPVLRSSYVRLK
jgi:hypothetical protein